MDPSDEEILNGMGDNSFSVPLSMDIIATNIVAYISGSTINKLEKKIKCSSCMSVLLVEETSGPHKLVALKEFKPNCMSYPFVRLLKFFSSL